MPHEGVLCIEPSLSETAIFTPKWVAVSDLNYDYLRKIKYHCPYKTVYMLTWALLTNTLQPYAYPDFSWVYLRISTILIENGSTPTLIWVKSIKSAPVTLTPHS